MSMYKNDSMLSCVDLGESSSIDEELYAAANLMDKNQFEDWMDKGVDCFFTKTTSLDSPLSGLLMKDDITFPLSEEEPVKQSKKDVNIPNILRSQNSKINKNKNALTETPKKQLKSDILLQQQASFIEVTINDDVCTVYIKDSDENHIFLPHNLVVNRSNEHTAEDSQVFSRLDITSINLVPVAKMGVKETVPQINTNIGTKFFLCPLTECQEAFHHISSAKLHALRHLGIKPYICDIPGCSWKFYTSFKLQRHKETHSTRKMFLCTYDNCNRGFTTIYNLRCHKKVHEKPATLQCPVKDCPEVFQTEKERRSHCKQHSASEAPFKCHCNKSFFTQMALQTHTRCHTHKESDLTCEFANCGKTFHTPYRLKEHHRAHTGIRPYVCDYPDCTWRFATASKLRRHQGTHSKDRKFHCTIGNCNKSFVRSEHLRDHTLTHIGQRTFECESCNLTFSGKSAHHTHMKKCHPNKKKDSPVPSTSNSPASFDIPFVPFSKIDKSPSPQQSGDVLLEQAIQSLDTVNSSSDLSILSTSCLLPEELLENDVSFSTVNLRDLE